MAKTDERMRTSCPRGAWLQRAVVSALGPIFTSIVRASDEVTIVLRERVVTTPGECLMPIECDPEQPGV
jgi:hypothetical protein